ncbi:MAG: hypothetical protein MJZ25_11690 [Fibrobacter sp.]|nr:hypothetical protein [Fibrobacter sp.]
MKLRCRWLGALVKGADYEELQEQYILFICPNDIFHKEKAIYKFQNREECDPNILLGDLCYKNFYIFKKYRMDPAARKAYMTLEQELNIRCKKLIKEEKQRIAKALVAQGKLTVSEIAEISGLSPEEIKAL